MLPGHDYGWTHDAPARELRRFVFKEVASMLRSSDKKNMLTNQIVKAITANFVYAQVKGEFREQGACEVTILESGVYELRWEGEDETYTLTAERAAELYAPQSAQRLAEEAARDAYDNVIAQQAIRKAELDAAMALLKAHRQEKP